MFYLSKAEQVALFALVALLLAGAGVLTYQRGREAGEARGPEPLFVEAKAAPAQAPVEGEAAEVEEEVVAEPALAAATPDPVPAPKTEFHRPAKAFPPAPTGPLSLNRATASQLEALPGIGPVLAKRILQYRDQRKRENGHGFESVDELLNVSGLGPKRLAGVRDRVTP
jgi:competence ComEA-like helix-hairpin-helix protein